MATYVLIHGAGSDSWYWHLVSPMLTDLGHTVIAPDLPVADDSAGLAEYAACVVRSVAAARPSDGDRDGEVIVVAQSLGGFTAPLVCDDVGATMLVYVAAMVPQPGESPGEWWADTGWDVARAAQAVAAGRAVDGPFDPMYDFLHDVPAGLVAEVFGRGESAQSGTPFEKPWPLAALPDLPTRFVLCSNDRFFPAPFMRRVVRDRLGFAPDEIASGHLPALSHPAELVALLERYRTVG